MDPIPLGEHEFAIEILAAWELAPLDSNDLERQCRGCSAGVFCCRRVVRGLDVFGLVLVIGPPDNVFPSFLFLIYPKMWWDPLAASEK